MDRHEEIRGFLSSRRARLSPAEAGTPAYTGKRRVPGLRREEVAFMASVSTEYYTRLERGKAQNVSAEVLNAVADALRLDAAEREHLFNLFDAPQPRKTAPRPTVTRLRPAVQAILDSLPSPAIVQNERLDVVGSNALARALYAPMFAAEGPVPNRARFAFLHDAAHDFYQDWDASVRNVAALVHAAVGRNPRDAALVQLVGELTTGSPVFSELWAEHDVLRYRNCPKSYHHPEVGDLTVSVEPLELSMDAGLTMMVYGAEPGSASMDALNLLASWNAPEYRRDDQSAGSTSA